MDTLIPLSDEYALEKLFTLMWSTVFGLLLAADVTAHVSGHVFDLSDGPRSAPTKPLQRAR